MTDCYEILGVARHASSREIRAAFLARIKLCHPDAAQTDAAGDAGEISRAYWQLRDPGRRAEHDQRLFAPQLPQRRSPPRRLSDRRRPRSPARGAARPAVASPAEAHAGRTGRRRTSRSRPRNRRLEPMRALAGVAACALAIAGFTAASTQFRQSGIPQAQAAARAGVTSLAEKLPAIPRRIIDPDLMQAATAEFEEVLRRSGPAGAHLYARQCLMELAVRPSDDLRDRCVAFDDAASSWEGAVGRSGRASRRYFAPAQRFGRYADAAREISPGPIRESLLVEANYFARLDD